METKRHIAVSPCLWLRLRLSSKEKQRIANAIWQIYLQRQRSSSDATWVQMHVGKHRQTGLHTHLLSPSLALMNIHMYVDGNEMKPSLILYAWNAAACKEHMKNEVKFAKFQRICKWAPGKSSLSWHDFNKKKSTSWGASRCTCCSLFLSRSTSEFI